MVRVSDIVRELGPLIIGSPGDSTMDREIPLQAGAVTSDSRRTIPGGIFVTIKGANVDGLDYLGGALERGVRVVISESPRPADLGSPDDLCWLQVTAARPALARVAALVFGRPSERLALVGVTGTNGKTTITYLVESILRAAGLPAAVMGTISYRIADEAVAAQFTTPEAAEIQHFLHRAAEAGVGHAVMEVSSIGLAMHRTDRLSFAVAVFTNLTQDHLDFHQTMEAYFAAKRKLFDGSLGSHPSHAVINVDDAYGRELAGSWPAEAGTLWTYGIDSPARITIKKPFTRSTFGLEGLHFTAVTPAGELPIESPLVGRPHASNILGALGIGLALGLSVETITAGIRHCTGVPGRFERVSTAADDITVIVDYAHTPDALANVLQTIQSAQAGQSGQSGHSGRGTGRQAGSLTTVFGCGGDRDRTKRPLMGEEAGRWSERVIITSDNPRSEDPLLIMNDIRVGVDRTETSYELIVDRRAAIFAAITDARPGDVVLLAGKGHEDYQILPTGRIHFDDREVAREALVDRRRYPGRQVAARPGRPAGGER